MPMGILHNDEMEKELKDLNISILKIPEVEIIEINRGRVDNNGDGVKEIPSEIRKDIAENAIAGASAKELMSMFGVSASSISAYKNGATSTASYDNPDRDLKDNNDRFKGKIVVSAKDRLLKTLGAITDDKLNSAKLRDLSSLATAMSSVIRNVEPQESGVQINNRVLIYKPRMKEEEDYEVLTVNE